MASLLASHTEGKWRSNVMRTFLRPYGTFCATLNIFIALEVSEIWKLKLDRVWFTSFCVGCAIATYHCTLSKICEIDESILGMINVTKWSHAMPNLKTVADNTILNTYSKTDQAIHWTCSEPIRVSWLFWFHDSHISQLIPLCLLLFWENSWSSLALCI